jgi:choline kinase
MNASNLFEHLIVVTGYKQEKVCQQLDLLSSQINFPITVVTNPAYLTKSVLHSVELGLSSTGPGDVLLINGDTIYFQNLFTSLKLFLAEHKSPNLSIVGSLKKTKTMDDMLIQLNGSDKVMRVSKNLKYASAVSAGAILIPDSLRRKYLTILSRLITQKAHHDILDSLCQENTPVDFISVSIKDWIEIDTITDFKNAKMLFT